MNSKRRNVLFLCTGNSARSIFAEAILNSLSQEKFHAFSAGSHPKGAVHPLTLETLKLAHLPVDHLQSKSWDEFAQKTAPQMDFVITVCDSAAGEICPLWPGQPLSAHWSFPDPAAFAGSETERRAFFQDVFRQIRRRLELFAAIPIDKLDRIALKRELDAIGRTNP